MSYSIDKVINNLEQVSLSDLQIMRAFDNKCRIVKYTELSNYETIDQLFGNYDKVIVLFQTVAHNNGHWICICRYQNRISFFDSYGYPPDEQMKFSPFLQKSNTKLEFTRLLNSAKSQGYKIDVNKYKYQEKDSRNAPEPNTCGRFCIVRSLMNHLDSEQFNKFIKSSRMDPDKLVSLMTFIFTQDD